MTIAITSMFNDGYLPLANITHFQSKVPYAELHGYPVYAKTDDFGEGYDINFNKMRFTLDLFDEHPEIEWAFWLDADAMITNWTIPLEHFIDNDYHFIATVDRYNINAGSYFIRNSKEGREFFEEVWSHRFDEKYQKHHWHEQQCIIDLVDKYKSIMKFVSQREFNSYDYDFYNRDHGNTHDWDLFGKNGNWQPGDFVIHYPGVKQDARIELATAMLGKTVKSAPKVSIVIPCYNQAHFLKDAIESALNQTYKNIEVIVVDDGSQDDVKSVVDQYPTVQYIRQDNKGLPGARNTGISAATGEWILPLDSDDAIESDWIQVATGMVKDEHDIITTNVQHCDAEMKKLPYVWNLKYTTPQALFNANDLSPASMFSKKVWEESGGFDETMTIGYEDWEFWTRLTNHYDCRVKITPGKPMLLYRKHGHSMTNRADAVRDQLVAYIREKNYIGF
jgi:hypothetical protein